MNYRVLTVSREYGSGGARIAKSIADKLGWKLLDEALIDAIASAAHVDSEVVSEYDEHVEHWLHRLNRRTMRAAALAGGLAADAYNCFDEDVMNSLTSQIIEQAYADGNCVIVGRGAQCILHSKPAAFHIFVYAPFRERLRRLQDRLGSAANIEHRIHTVDAERARYLYQRFAKTWIDPHLYNLMILSREDEELTTRQILYIMDGNAN
jgi:cytidylate kinase